MAKIRWSKIPIRIYTDGSHSSRTQNGRWAYCVVLNNRETLHNSGGVADTTNNRMELLAILKALLEIVAPMYPDEPVYIVTDSSNSVNIIQKVLEKKRTNTEFFGYANRDLVHQIALTLLRFPKVQLHWVKGHTGNRWNERADVLAGDARIEIELKIP